MTRHDQTAVIAKMNQLDKRDLQQIMQHVIDAMYLDYSYAWDGSSRMVGMNPDKDVDPNDIVEDIDMTLDSYGLKPVEYEEIEE
jgi:hypothetical protein